VRLLICAGGTGGGVSPALAVLESVNTKAEILWVGGEGGMEAGLVERAGIPFRSIPASGIHGVGIGQLPGNFWQLGRGVRASRRILREFNPDALFFTGGYLAAPMAVAGMNIPTMLFVPDIEPALALRFTARFADRIAVSSEDSLQYFKGRRKVIVTGYPVRSDLLKWEREPAQKALNLNNRMPVLLVTGGSKGARSINTAVLANLPALLEMVQIIHISGELDWPVVEAKAREIGSDRYHAFPYLHEEMGAALAAADLVLSRAGASTLGEYPCFGLPAILVPYPYAWRYQKVNADYLVKNDAAIILEDARLLERIVSTLKALLESPEKLQSMRNAMKRLSRPQAAADISGHLLALTGGRR
jgi:UDP-N-acetylglucosamine--N-acetylmuramyl-(pentapeptide) pyrophosphoryl-undecaprenol N-acetylglucosamine transferase